MPSPSQQQIDQLQQRDGVAAVSEPFKWYPEAKAVAITSKCTPQDQNWSHTLCGNRERERERESETEKEREIEIERDRERERDRDTERERKKERTLEEERKGRKKV